VPETPFGATRIAVFASGLSDSKFSNTTDISRARFSGPVLALDRDGGPKMSPKATSAVVLDN